MGGEIMLHKWEYEYEPNFYCGGKVDRIIFRQRVKEEGVFFKMGGIVRMFRIYQEDRARAEKVGRAILRVLNDKEYGYCQFVYSGRKTLAAFEIGRMWKKKFDKVS
jgi:hypothetical protein